MGAPEALHARFMEEALAEARRAEAAGEVPIGAVVAVEGTVVGRGHNRPIGAADPTAHAEVVAIRKAARELSNYRLSGLTLYVTVEPCMMCVGAIVQARIGTLVYGAPEPKFGAVDSLLDLREMRIPHRLSIVSGILEEECQRQNAPDGGNREQAFAYQTFVLDFLLLAGFAARARGEDFSPLYWRRLEAMVDFLASMTGVSGILPQVGDADDGYVVRLAHEPGFSPHASLIATGAVLFERPDLAAKAGTADSKTVTLLGVGAVRRLARLKQRGRAGFRERPLPPAPAGAWPPFRDRAR